MRYVLRRGGVAYCRECGLLQATTVGVVQDVASFSELLRAAEGCYVYLGPLRGAAGCRRNFFTRLDINYDVDEAYSRDSLKK